jgi:hypothetical protein
METIEDKIKEYVELARRQREIMRELSLKDAIYLFYALGDGGLVS